MLAWLRAKPVERPDCAEMTPGAILSHTLHILSRLLIPTGLCTGHWLPNSRNFMAPQADKYMDQAVDLVRCLPRMHTNWIPFAHRS